jgi:CRP-like cAMP-binding protein
MDKLVAELINNHDLWLETRTIERNEFISQPGEIERYFYFVEDGALRVFFLTEFEEITIRFGYKGSIMTSLPSFFTEKPTIFYIQAIRKSKIRVMEKRKFYTFVHENPARREEYELLLQSFVTQQIEREIDILTYSPVERLRRVQERSPHLFQEIPSKYIASYLRMTPETLSRIRKS